MQRIRALSSLRWLQWTGPLPRDAAGARLQRPMRRSLAAAVLMAALLQPASSRSSGAGSHASAASTSRWWTLDCGQGSPSDAAPPATCTFTLRIRGAIDASRSNLVRRAIERRDQAARALHRDVSFRVDVDTQGGEVFAAMEIGRLLRSEQASISVREGASCISACVFLLMGAVERSVSDGARVGIHRLSLRATPAASRDDALVDAMAEGVLLYAEQMNVPRAIVDEMMSIPADRVELLTPQQLARYGIPSIDLTR